MVNNPPAFDAANPSGIAAVLLVLTPFEENAKRVESHLRNAGHKVRCLWISELVALEKELQRAVPDLLMAASGNPELELKLVIDTCRRFAPNLPVLGLAAELQGQIAVSAVAAGARDVVSDASPESLAHLERVYLRESAAHRNLRELARARSLLADYESRYTQLLEGTGDAVAHIYEGILSQCNPAFAALLGYEDDAELAATPIMDLVPPDHQAAFREHLKLLNKGRADGEPLNCGMLKKNGETAQINAMLTRGEADGEHFIEMLIRAEKANSAAASPRSGRSDFYQAVAAPAEAEHPRAALFIAVDGSQDLEARLGLIDSEVIFGKVCDALHKQLGNKDSLHLLSSAEFGVCMTRTDAQEFEHFAEKLLKSLVAKTYTSADHEAQISVSISVYPIGASDTADQILSDLTRETRRLSSNGGNQFQVLGETARSNASERVDQRKIEEVRSALEAGRLKLAYQTIASLEGDTRQHFDVLLRMINEDGVELHASDFILAAERGGMMRSLDRWVISRALKVIDTREKREENSMLFLKLSEDTLKEAEAFIAWIGEIRNGVKFGNEEVCFEMRESVAQDHVRKAKLLAKAMREMGACVAIEHFGVGTNSKRMIEELQINFLKFHSSFTSNFDDKANQKKMTELMELAKQKKIKTIVSHVEDANVMARMWQMGVNYIQGYHVQEPEVVMLS